MTRTFVAKRNPTRLALLIGATMIAAATIPATAEEKIFDNWNTAGCGMIDNATFDLSGPVHVSQIEVWYHWNQGETAVPFDLSGPSGRVTSGQLTRGGCDPYQTSWCGAHTTAPVDLPAGTYTIQAGRAGICQNGGSGGVGFVHVFGTRAAVGSGSTGPTSQPTPPPTDTATGPMSPGGQPLGPPTAPGAVAQALVGTWALSGHQNMFPNFEWQAELVLQPSGGMTWRETKGANVGASRTGDWNLNGNQLTFKYVTYPPGLVVWTGTIDATGRQITGTYVAGEGNAFGGEWSGRR